MGDSYYRFFPGDYLRDTGDLTLLEHGAYRILLDHYYTMECLTCDRNRLYRMCRAETIEEKQAIEFVVTRYFSENGNGHLLNKKAEKELAGRRAFFEDQARKAKLGGEVTKQRWKEGSITRPEARPVGLPEEGPKASPPSPSPSPSPIPTPSPKNKKLFVDTSDEVRLSESLLEKILINNPQAKKPNIQVWAKQIDLMIRSDHRTPEDIQAVIEWCQDDDFWKQNILSTKKLREKFDQLWVKMASRPLGKHKGTDEWLRLTEEKYGKEEGQ